MKKLLILTVVSFTVGLMPWSSCAKTIESKKRSMNNESETCTNMLSEMIHAENPTITISYNNNKPTTLERKNTASEIEITNKTENINEQGAFLDNIKKCYSGKHEKESSQ